MRSDKTLKQSQSLVIKKILMHTGLMKVCHSFFNNNESVGILRYHAVVDAENNFYASPSICIAPETFEYQIKYFADNYNIITLDIVYDCLTKHKKFPNKAIVITFDDGYKDNFLAYKTLKKYGVRGTFYISSGVIDGKQPLWLFEVIYVVKNIKSKEIVINVNDRSFKFLLESENQRWLTIKKITEIIKSNPINMREEIREQLRKNINDIKEFEEKASKVMLTWDQIKEMSDNGMTIGGHTITHLNLPNALREDAIHEIAGCKRQLEEKINKEVVHFSYPNGGNYAYYDDSIKEMVINANYCTATTSNNGVVKTDSDPYELKRIRVTNELAEILYQIDCEHFMERFLLK